ncbi:MAG: alpha/beta hydrolase [Chloroflexota bacterium]|nr:MAG: alpha/beta hydrolase [Chloroflexota bacterium]
MNHLKSSHLLLFILLLFSLALPGCASTAPAATPASTAAPLPTAAPTTTPTLPVPSLQVERDMAYDETGGADNLADVYYLAPIYPGEKRPAVMLIHGGGWQAGSKEDFAGLALLLVNEGYVVVSINYRLVHGDSNHFPAQLDDVQQAVRWIRHNAAKYGIDPERVTAMGDSAGGHLAALLGVMDTRDDSDPALPGYSSRADCVVDLYGPVDLTSLNPRVPLNVLQVVTQLIGQPYGDAPDLYRQASPIFRIDERTSPFFIAHGDQDLTVPVEQSRRLYLTLQEAGVKAEYLELEGQGHGFTGEANERFIEAMLSYLEGC